MGTSSKELAQKLRKLARRQHGCFTAGQAIEAGYADSVHLYHVRNGEWVRVFRGVYRFADSPPSSAVRCMAALLWTRDKNGKVQGALAPATAQAMQAGALENAQPVEIKVPKHFRRSSPVPEGIKLIFDTIKNHKTSNKSSATRPNVEVSISPPLDGLDMPDYYDWLDFQASRCGTHS